ncbi:unnamed protein product [Camellia sinensis]
MVGKSALLGLNIAKNGKRLPCRVSLVWWRNSQHIPSSISDVSNIRQVPDHQEVFADPARDESLIFELLDLKLEVADNGSATWFIQNLAREQDAEGVMVGDDVIQYSSLPELIASIKKATLEDVNGCLDNGMDRNFMAIHPL